MPNGPTGNDRPSYVPRIVDEEVERALRTSGAISIKGPRACGKTSTGRQFAQSVIQLDRDTPEAALAHAAPSTALDGATPRLIDEWQEVPAV